MSEYYVLDACALIAFLNDEAGADVVEELLRKSNRQEPNLFLHRINLLEVYYGIYREVGPEVSEQVLGKIRALPVTEVTEITQEVFLEAGRLKATYRLSLADSIAAAEAKVLGASLVTADHHEFEILATREDVAFRWIR